MTNLQTALDSTQHRVWEEKLEPVLKKLPNNDRQLIDMTMSGGIKTIKVARFLLQRNFYYANVFLDYAFLSYLDGSLTESAEYLSCRLIPSSRPYFSDQTAFALQKDSPLTGLLSYHLRRIVETGVAGKIEHKWKKADRGIINLSFFFT